LFKFLIKDKVATPAHLYYRLDFVDQSYGVERYNAE